MNVLFISSGNSKNGINPIIQKQGESIAAMNISLDYFVVKGKGMRSYFSAIFELRKELNKTKYDIIHAHYALCGWVAFLAHSNQKLVVSFMGDDLLGSNKSNGSVSKGSLVMAAFNKLLVKLFFDASIVKSPQMLDKFGSSKKNSLIANGVNSLLFKPSDKTAAQKKVGFDCNIKHVVFVSDPLRVEKNFALAEKACSLIKDYTIMLHAIYGKNNTELPDYYNAADVVLMTSFHEGSPNVVKEAMSCNCPVVCTNVGDVELLFKNTSGNFITNFDVEDVKYKICSAIKYRTENKFTNGRERIFELNLDAPSVAKKIIDVYHKLIK